MKKRKYYVTYNFDGGNWCCRVTRKTKINSHNQIIKLAQDIADDIGKENVIISNYKEIR